MRGLRNQHDVVLPQNEINEGKEKDGSEGEEDDDRLDSSMGSQLLSITCHAPVTLRRRKPW